MIPGDQKILLERNEWGNGSKVWGERKGNSEGKTELCGYLVFECCAHSRIRSLGLSLGSISPSVKCLKEQCQPHKPVEVIHVVCSELCLAHSGRSVNLALISSVIVTAFHTYLPCSFPREIVCPQTRTHLPVNCSHSYLHLSFPLITTIQNLKNSRKLLA